MTDAELTEQLAAARQDAKEAEAYAEELEKELDAFVSGFGFKRDQVLEAKLAKAVEALRELIDHTHNCEKELTEELHGIDFCGESLPLTKARATLAEIKGESHE